MGEREKKGAGANWPLARNITEVVSAMNPLCRYHISITAPQESTAQRISFGMVTL